jgi:hypothetical protein
MSTVARTPAPPLGATSTTVQAWQRADVEIAQLRGDRLGDRGLLAGQQPLVALNDGHHGAEHGEQHAELTGHRTAADHHQRVRQLIAGQRLRTGPGGDRR